MIKAFVSAWRRAFDFRGKSTRKEYWYFLLADVLFVVALDLVKNIFASASLSLYSTL